MTETGHLHIPHEDQKHISTAVGKFFRRIIPMLAIMLIINQIDRSNIGFIKAELQTDAGDQRRRIWTGSRAVFYWLCAVWKCPAIS